MSKVLIRAYPAGSRWLAPLLLVLALLLVAGSGRAQTTPPRPNPPRLVNDLAGLMRPDEANALEQKLVAYNDSTSSQIAVVTVPSLDGDEIANYAQRLYEAWGIGQQGKNNGILVLVAAQEHQARIQTGYGLEGAVPDALAKRIISNTLVPAFRQNQYYVGLDRATDQLIALARGEYKADPRDARGEGGSGPSFWVIIVILVVVFFLLSRRGGGRGGRGNRSRGGGFVPPIIFGDFSGGRGGFGGWGGGGGGGGGFGGFGGGSSGGGGASGSW